MQRNCRDFSHQLPNDQGPRACHLQQGPGQLLTACPSLRGSCKAKPSLAEPGVAIREALDEMLDWTAEEEEPKGDVVPAPGD